MKIYDKAAWHIDGGEKKEDVLRRFSIIFSYLAKNNMLTDEGKEILELGIDSSVSLHERMVNESGKTFLDKEYDTLLSLPLDSLRNRLQ